MTIADWLLILVVLAAPLIAVFRTRHLDHKKYIKKQKKDIFNILMTTRVHNALWTHVEALNRIDLEYNELDKKEKIVIDAWKEYQDLLNAHNPLSEQWRLNRVDLLANLLHKMAQFLGYRFTKIQIKNSCYDPALYGNIEEENVKFRRYLTELLEGRRSLPVYVPESKEPQN